MGDGVASESWAKLSRLIQSSEEGKLKSIVQALLKEPVFVNASEDALVARLAERSGFSAEEVWRLTGLKKPEPPPVLED